MSRTVVLTGAFHRAAVFACICAASLLGACDDMRSPSQPTNATVSQAAPVITQPIDHRFDGHWNLTKIGDAPVPERFRKVHFRISGDSISANNGCNTFSKSRTSEAGVSTAVACTEGDMIHIDFDDVFKNDPSHGMLQLQMKRGQSSIKLTFERAAELP